MTNTATIRKVMGQHLHRICPEITQALDDHQLTKVEASMCLEEAAMRLRQPGESEAQAFTKAVTGMTPRLMGAPQLLAKIKALPGPDHHQVEAIAKAMSTRPQPISPGGNRADTTSESDRARERRGAPGWQAGAENVVDPGRGADRASMEQQALRSWNAAVDAVMRSRPGISRSTAITIAQNDPGARAHYEAAMGRTAA